jgi:membrane fusion protein (multidrug efflux system)
MKKKVFSVLIIFMAAACAVIFAAVFLWPQKHETKPDSGRKKPPVVETIAAFQTRLERVLNITGSVEPWKEAHLASFAEGPVEKLNVREGDLVKAGSHLVLVGRKKGAVALIDSLKTELKKEEDNFKRTRQLVEKGTLAKEALDEARTSFEKVKAQLVDAEQSAADFIVSAPWDGVVSRIHVKEGEYAASRRVLLEIYDPLSLVIRAAVAEQYAAAIKKNMKVKLSLDVCPEKTVQAEINRIYPYLDSRLRTRTVEIVPKEPVDLLPGMFARLKIVLKSVDNAVVIPKEALFSCPRGLCVFVVEDKKAVMRQVETGIEENTRIEVISGVSAGDKVVTEGYQKLKDGQSVAMTKKESPESSLQ